MRKQRLLSNQEISLINNYLMRAEIKQGKFMLMIYELIELDYKKEHLCNKLPILKQYRLSLENRLKRRVLISSLKIIELEIKAVLLIANKNFSKDSSLKELTEIAGRYLPSKVTEKIKLLDDDSEINPEELTIRETVKAAYSRYSISEMIERQIKLLSTSLVR